MRNNERLSGILLHPTSLPSPYGIGDLGRSAYEFVDFLEKAGQHLWQILPLTHTGYGDSPYQSFSAYAGQPLLISPDHLEELGLIRASDLADVPQCDPEHIDYGRIIPWKQALLEKAYSRFKNTGYHRPPLYLEFARFTRREAFWLDDYALFMACKSANGGVSWLEWEDCYRIPTEDGKAGLRDTLSEQIGFYQFIQFIFYKEWLALKSYANDHGVRIIGDIPIYVAFDSADTWANPELFQLDDDLTPLAVAGCPPDSFSATGQLWGNPLYRWDYHKDTDYEWWMKRIAYCFTLYDVVRIDHFRGFDEYYSIPYGDETAEFGHWEKGPGYDIFQTMKSKLGKKAVIAEDLGFLTDSVLELVKKTGYPGMKILQFAFDSREESDYLPHNYTANSVVYTGTHDNDTVLGWIEALDEHDGEFARRYMNIRSDREIQWEFIRAAMASVSDTCIIPMQDYLGLGAEARINVPSTLGTNWKWRMLPGAFDEELAHRIRRMTKLYGRIS